MSRTVTRDDVLGGDATVAIGGGDMPGGPQPYGAGCAVPRPGPGALAVALRHLCPCGSRLLKLPALVSRTAYQPSSPAATDHPDLDHPAGSPGLRPPTIRRAWLAPSPGADGRRDRPTAAQNIAGSHRRSAGTRRAQPAPGVPLASESDGTLIRAVRTHAPVQPYATAPRRWSPARSRSSAAVRSRATLHTHAYADLIGAPRKTPEKPGSSTRAQARTRWSGLFAHARGRDEPDELAGAG